MKVNIDHERSGWYYYPADYKFDDEFGPPKSRERFETYDEVRRHIKASPHEHDNAGWRHKMLSWNFTSHSLDGYPGWETEKIEHGRPIPAFVKLEHKRGPDGSEVESLQICRQWDDIAKVDFYQRDWTDDGIPFVRPGETYWSGWWFATIEERDRFASWQAEQAKVAIERNVHEEA